MNAPFRAPFSRRRRRGQALVEFALVAPWFFLILFGIVEGGRFMLYYETLKNATREGARYAIVNGERSFTPVGPSNPQAVIDKVKAAAFGVLGNGVTVTPTWGGSPANNQRGTIVTVHAAYTYSSLVPLVPLPPITVQAESSLVINN